MIYLNKKAIAFIVGLLSATQVQIIGTFALGEFVMFLGLVYLFFKNPYTFRTFSQSKRMITLLTLCFLWICAIFFSDQINETGLTESLKGIGGVIPLFFSLLFFYWLLFDNLSLMYFFVFGYAISVVISMFIFVPSALESMMVKTGADSLMEVGSLWSRLVAAIISGFVLVFSFKFYPKHPYLVSLLQFANAFYALLQGSRGVFLLGLVGTFLLFHFAKYSRFDYLNPKTVSFIRKRTPLLVIIILLGGFVAKNIYSFVAEKGYMGEIEKIKYEKQSSSNIGLLSGRSEFVSVYLAVSDAPWLGHGSYALDEEGYAIEAAELTGDTEYIDRLVRRKGELLIPSHSHLMTSWVYHGVLGAVFWFYALYLIIRYLLRYIYIYPKYLGYLPASLGMVWNILFSPFQNRLGLGAFFAFIIIMMDQIDKKNKLNAKRICKY